MLQTSSILFAAHTSGYISVSSLPNDSWGISYNGTNIVVHSDETKFWVTNDRERVLTTDTLKSNLDEIVILSANLDADEEILGENKDFNVVRQVIITDGEESGTESIHDLEVIPTDENLDGFPDNINLDYLIAPDDYVYFYRENSGASWVFQPYSEDVLQAYTEDQANPTPKWKRERGREGLNFLWMHRTPRYHLIDPSATNLIDVFILTRGYYSSVRQWLSGLLTEKPKPPSTFSLRSDYSYLLDNKMISDSLILHAGKIKPIFGDLADNTLQATIKVIQSSRNHINDNQLKTTIVDIVNEFFDINKWEFGETFYFTELSALIHSRLPTEIDSVVLVPKYNNHLFGDLYQVLCREDEIIQPHIGVDDIEIIESINATNIKQLL